MLIDLSIVTLVSILYYLLCSVSRIFNLIGGMLLIFLLCWAVGVDVTYDTSVSEITFLIIAIIINVWITIHSHKLVKRANSSRMNRFHHHNNDHIYTVRNRINNFHVKSINDRFKATLATYLRIIKHQINDLNRYVKGHSNYSNLSQLIKSFTVLQSEVDDINYHLDLAMQINVPRSLKRLIHEYYQIIKQAGKEITATKQAKTVIRILNHGMPNSRDTRDNYTYINVNLRFPYQRLIHDRVRHQIDLLNISRRGIFAFTLINTSHKYLNVNRKDEITTREINSKRYRYPGSTLNLKKKVNLDLEAINYLIPSRINVVPHVGIISTNPRTKINLADPHFRIIKPQELSKLMDQYRPKLASGQVLEIKNVFRDCFSKNKKYEWLVFNSRCKRTISDLLWYQQQIKTLDHKLMG